QRGKVREQPLEIILADKTGRLHFDQRVLVLENEYAPITPHLLILPPTSNPGTLAMLSLFEPKHNCKLLARHAQKMRPPVASATVSCVWIAAARPIRAVPLPLAAR